MEFCFDCENLCFYWDYSSARHIVRGIGSEVNGMGDPAEIREPVRSQADLAENPGS